MVRAPHRSYYNQSTEKYVLSYRKDAIGSPTSRAFPTGNKTNYLGNHTWSRKRRKDETGGTIHRKGASIGENDEAVEQARAMESSCSKYSI